MTNLNLYKTSTEHNNIRYFKNEAGMEMLYHTVEKWTAATVAGVTKVLECKNETTVTRAHEGVTLIAPKKAEALTPGGLQVVTLIFEEDLPKVLKKISKGQRTHAPTKRRAGELYDKLAQAGYKLMVLLEVAPELVAAEAIGRIEDQDKLDQVKALVVVQKDYVQSKFALDGAMTRQIDKELMKAVDPDSYMKYTHGEMLIAKTVSKLNKVAKVRNGERKSMPVEQRMFVTGLQSMTTAYVNAHPERMNYEMAEATQDFLGKLGALMAE